ncbi:MAG: excisionase family DNA-binding protein [Pseudomonadota bacterium]|nr:excisionase family DNA-binding protein [Pseudomonadota bacterium]
MLIEDRLQERERPMLDRDQAEMARAAQQCIVAALDHSRAASITLFTDAGDSRPEVQIPPQALRFIGDVLGAMSEGRSVVIMRDDQEFGTVAAANFLNVSRPFLVKEIEHGKIPYRKVGTHRRIAFRDLVAYERTMRASQAQGLSALAESNRELGLEY